MISEFYLSDLWTDPDSPFARDADGKLIGRAFWLDLGDSYIVLAMTQGVGANLTNDQNGLTFGTSVAGSSSKMSVCKKFSRQATSGCSAFRGIDLVSTRLRRQHKKQSSLPLQPENP